MSLFAYDGGRLVEHHGATLADVEKRAAGLPKIWVDVQGLADVELIRGLGERYGLHPLTVADVVHVHQRPKLESHDDHLFIVLRLPDRTEGLLTEQLSILLGRDFVLTFQERPGDCFDPVRERLRRAASGLRERGVDYLAYALIDALVDSYFPILESYGELIEVLEEQVIAQPEPARVARIQRLRRELLEIRRALWPQREVLSALMREDTPCIAPGTRVFLRDCADHTAQLLDMVEIHREVASGLLDLHLSSLSTRMNEIMKVLTIIATIFIPLGFIAGLYGMNFDPQASPFNMPELHWRFGYPFALALMLAVALGMLAYFWRSGWLGGRRDRSDGDAPGQRRRPRSDEKVIRGLVDQGDEVIELTRDGNWVGVRVLQTGEEGWIYGGLLQQVAQSGLLPGDGRAAGGGDAGFLQLSEGFDRLIRRVNDDLGYAMVEEAAPVADGVLQVRPTAAWLRSAGRDAHMMGALAFYQLWKNYQDGRPCPW